MEMRQLFTERYGSVCKGNHKPTMEHLSLIPLTMSVNISESSSNRPIFPPWHIDTS